VIDRTPVDLSLERTSIEKERLVSARAWCALIVAAGRGSVFAEENKAVAARTVGGALVQNEMGMKRGNLA